MTVEEVKMGTERFPWALVIIISIILPFIGTYCIEVGKSGLGFWTGLGLVEPNVPIVVAPFLMLFLAWIVTRIDRFKGRIDAKWLGYLYVVTVIVTFSFVGVDDGTAFNYFVGARMVSSIVDQQYIPSLLAPSKEAAQLLWTGGTINMVEWLPVLASYWILYLMPSIFLIGLYTLFRRRWIDIESVPFPTVMVANEVLKQVSGSAPSIHGIKRAPFVVGMIVGVIIQTIYLLIQIFPWFPDVFAIRGGCGAGCALIWAAYSPPWSGIVGFGTVLTNPMIVAFFYFIPLSILFNSWFWYVVFLVLAQLAFMMGYYTGYAGGPWEASRVLSQDPYKFMAVSQVGGMIGLTIFSVFLSRGYLAETIRASVGRLPKDRINDIERNEAISYKLTWLLILLGFIGTTMVFMMVGLGIIAALLMPISIFFFLFADTRMFGMSGVYMRGWNHRMAFYRLLWPTAPDPLTREFVVSSIFSRRELDLCDSPLNGFTYGEFSAYRMSDLARLSNRRVFIILLIVALISPIMVIMSEIWIGSNYGLSRTLGTCTSAYTCGAPWSEGASSWVTLPTTEPWIPYMLLGIAIVGVLSVLHARYLWFPFEPIGFLNGTSFNSTISGLWFPFLVAWILKTITLRIGGSKTYEGYGLPFAGGVVAGCAAIAVLGTILGIVRFFVPF